MINLPASQQPDTADPSAIQQGAINRAEAAHQRAETALIRAQAAMIRAQAADTRAQTLQPPTDT